MEVAATVNIAVCDDEKNIRRYLVSLIKKQNIPCSIIEYACADAYLSDRTDHDLVFLDVEMDSSGPGMDGMGLARHIRGMNTIKQPVIVFVTGYEKYVYDAFDVDAFQFLVKPVDEQRFAQVFGRAVEKILSEREQQRKKLVIQHRGRGKAILLQNIYYMESRNHNIVMYLNNEKIEFCGKIGVFEEELQGQFYRIHRGYLINLYHVEEYNRTEVTMANGDKLLLSRYKYDGFVKAYMNYISEENE